MTQHSRPLLPAVLFTVIGVTTGLAQAPQSGSAFPKASGPMGPRPVGRSEWRVPTLVELGTFLGWKVGVPASEFHGLTLSEAVVRVDKLALGFIEGSDTQWVSPEIRKNLDYKLTADEVNAVKRRLRKFRLQMTAYHVERMETDDAASRRLFQFAKDLGVETIITGSEPTALPVIDQMANEFGINVAIEGAGSPRSLVAAFKGRSSRIGLRVDVAAWTQAGVDAKAALSQLRDRVVAVSLRDRSSLSAAGRDVPLGYGALDTKQFLLEMYRLGIKPVFFTLNATGALDATADLAHSVDGFEEAVLPVLGDYMIRRSKTLEIRGPAELTPDVREKIVAAIPAAPVVKPLKPRRLLVMDQHMGHTPIPHTNYALELMGKSTGAFEAVFSNDLDNLKYDKLRQFDAVMLNSSESDIAADPEVREGLLRFVREGGGIGGIHAASWSAAFWPEFMEMFGASQGPHQVQQATMKVDDPNSPLVSQFVGQPLTYTDEYYRMTDTGLQGTYYSRDKVHVLLSVDVAKTPEFNTGRTPFVRQDNDYAVAWIKGYGKGRVFYTCLGHTPQMFMDPKMNQFLLAAMQFILGDLPADTTPSSELGLK